MWTTPPVTFTKTFFSRSKLPLNHNFGQDDVNFYHCTMRHLWDFGVESSSVSARIFWRFAQSLSAYQELWWVMGIGKISQIEQKIQYGCLEKVTLKLLLWLQYVWNMGKNWVWRISVSQFQWENIRYTWTCRHFDDPVFQWKAGLILSQVHNTKGNYFSYPFWDSLVMLEW